MAARRRGLGIYRVDKLVGAALDEAALSALPILTTISGLGTLLARRHARSGDGAVLSLLFATSISPEDLSFLIFDPLLAYEAEHAGPDPGFAGRPSDAGRLPRILVVDDEAISLLMAQEQASAFGRVTSAAGADEALALFEAALASEPFSLVILDIVLPTLSGHQVLARMRALEQASGARPGEGAKIMMLSALRDYDAIGRSFRESADAYLVKPIARAAFTANLRKLGFLPYEVAPAAAPMEA